MPFAKSLTHWLYSVSDALLLPALLVLVVLVAWCLMLLGAFCAEAWARAGAPGLDGTSMRATPLVRRYLEAARALAGRGELLRQQARECELWAMRALEGAQIVTRVAPALGLVGTLIPMGPALASMAHGDTNAMADHVRAFATTVLGLVVGCVAFAVSCVRRRWYAKDLSDIELLCDQLAEQKR